MYQFVNFGVHNNTLNSPFCRNTENSKIIDRKVHKMVHLVS